MLSKELINQCIKNINIAIENTTQIDLKHNHRKLFQLSKNNKPLGIFFSMAEIADHLELDIKYVRRIREGRNNKYYNAGYRITTIEYKH